MRSLVVVAIVGLGCKDKPKPPPQDPEPSPLPPKGIPFRAGGADGLAKAAVSSLPVKDWPCATRSKNFEGDLVTSRIVYERREPCTVPATLVDATLGGCPARYLNAAVRYNAEGRLVYAWPSDFRWGKSGPIERIVSDRVVGKFGALADDVATSTDDSLDQIVRFDAEGRIVTVENVKHNDVVATGEGFMLMPATGGVAWSTKLDYDGARIVRVRAHGEHSGDTETEVLYDCSSLPPDVDSGSGSAR